jgi:hypothetical protein
MNPWYLRNKTLLRFPFDPRRAVSAAEFAESRGFPKPTVLRWLAKGILPGIRSAKGQWMLDYEQADIVVEESFVLHPPRGAE